MKNMPLMMKKLASSILYSLRINLTKHMRNRVNQPFSRDRENNSSLTGNKITFDSSLKIRLQSLLLIYPATFRFSCIMIGFKSSRNFHNNEIETRR